MSFDPTESARREMIATDQPAKDLAAAPVRWTTAEMSALFTVHSFLAPFVMVTHKATGKRGTMEFTHNPRFYFNFVAED